MAFIPAAERYGLSAAIDRWVIAKLFADPPFSLLDEGTASLISINLSAAALADPDFLEFLTGAVAASGIAPGRLCFEIAESAAITNLHRSTHFIETLKAAGCRFALDDFGSGPSSFAYLKALPVDYLKIDGGIVKGIASDAIDCATVAAIHQISQVLGMRTVAKFVENESVLQTLQSIGIDYAQGFGLHAPELIGLPVTA